MNELYIYFSIMSIPNEILKNDIALKEVLTTKKPTLDDMLEAIQFDVELF
jgi:hypothetical protein